MKIIKRCYLDANILINYGDKLSPLNKKSMAIIKQLILSGISITLSSLTLDEYEYIVLRSSEESRSQTILNLKKSLKKILKLPQVQLINPPLEAKKHLKVLNLMEKFNLKPRDAYHLFIALEGKVEYFATFDSDFDELFDQNKIKRFDLSLVQN